MKKKQNQMKYMFYVLFFFVLLFASYTKVYAKTVCTYSTGGEKNNIVLETDNYENVLTKGSGFANQGTLTKNVTFYDKNGISLSSGNCPTISVFVTTWNADYIVYQSKDECEKDKGKGKCIENVNGTKGDTDQSTSSNANSRQQYKLKSSTDTSCKYISEPTQDTTIEVTKKDNQTASFDCDVSSTVSTVCDMENNPTSLFYKDNAFTCPAYIYADKVSDYTSNLAHYRIKIVESGTEADTDRTLPENRDTENSNVDLNGLNSGIGCEGIFGKTDGNGNFTKESFGWLIQTALNYIKIIGPVLVIILSMLEFIKAIATSDEDAMKKAQSRLVVRLIAVVVLFLLPFLVGEVLKLINGISNPTCGFK